MHNNSHSPLQNQGFTLVEVLIAASILGIGLLAIASVISQSTIQDSRAYYMSRASMIMEEYIENNSRIQYNSTLFNNFNGTSKNSTIDGIEYNLQCNTSRNAPISNLDTIETECTITWNNKGIPSRTQYVYVFSKNY